MRLLPVWLTLVSVSPLFAADAPTLTTARQRWLRGNYAEARSQYEALAKDPKLMSAALIGVSRCWQSEGEYDKATAALEAALKAQPGGSADLLARRAELLYLRGRWKEADDAAATALKLSKDHLLARWVRAQLLRDRGEQKKADDEMRWFVRTYSERSNADMDIKDPDELLLVGLAGAENARWHNLAEQFKVILNDVYGDALKADKDFWLAEYQAGVLLLEKYNKAEAADAFDKALKINPNAAEALVGKGLLAVQNYEIRDAVRFAERALKINEHLPEALRLRADLHLLEGNVPAALKELDAARKVNPRDEATLGRIAACLLIQRKKEDLDTLVKEVTEHDPKPGVFYHELAERLDERRLFDSAEGFYRKAIELRPIRPGPQNSLGLLLMRMGRETEARKLLNQAYEADPFNVRVGNTLKVLRHLDKYETVKTEHFELRFDPKLDKVLGRFMAADLETIYEDLSKQFNYRPMGPFVVEVFNNHEMFSGRITALPDLHTIGACTGRMMALVSPRGKGIAKPFNWGRVLRHELVHIFNLDQTNFQVPHWLTEGLAVQNEGFPRPQPWNQLLLQRVPAGELMNLDNITEGFVRPRVFPDDWHMAYCQSNLYVEYVKAKYGPQAIADLLQAYRDGLDNAAAVKKACKVDKAKFEADYKTYLQDVVKSLRGKPADKKMTVSELTAAHEKEPEDLDIAARLAEAYLRQNRKKEARTLVDAVLARKKGHGLASYVKARLLLAAGDEDEARKLLELAVDRQTPDANVVQLLGKLYYDAKEMAKAREMYELGRKAEPFESKWLVELARVYGQTGDKDKLIAVLKDLAPTDADDFDVRKRLAKLLLDVDKPADAEKYAREALEIDVQDREMQETLLQSLAAQKKDQEAERVRKLLEK
jgi:tetratricopeptide (TPR) repeat protein